MRKIIILISITFLLLNSSCFFRFGTVKNDPDLKMGLAIDREKAFDFSSNLVEDIKAEKNEIIYSKMNELSHKTFSVDEIEKAFEKINEHFGKLIETKYKAEEVGYWLYPDGTKKPMRKFFYSAKTEKAEMGKYFLQIAVIAENENLKCANFSMVEFPDGVPKNLK